MRGCKDVTVISMYAHVTVCVLLCHSRAERWHIRPHSRTCHLAACMYAHVQVCVCYFATDSMAACMHAHVTVFVLLCYRHACHVVGLKLPSQAFIHAQ